jgi:threonine synthase
MAPVRVAGTRTGIWRHRDVLPPVDPVNAVSLGEGDTPLVPLSPAVGQLTGVASVLAKAEHRNPTGSFKDRIAAVAVALAADTGMRGCLGTSSGNGGAALAAYSAAARQLAVLAIRSDVVAAKLREIRAFGAIAALVDPGRDDGAALDAKTTKVAALAAESGFLPFITAFRFSPEAMRGAATIAVEIAESAPRTTAIYAPVGGGGLLTALWLGYRLTRDRLPGRPPRLVGVQPTGCATLGRALAGGPPGLDRPLSTKVSGLQVSLLLDADSATAAVRESGGHAVEVEDEEIAAAQRLLARQEGLLVEPAGATALAGVLADARAGRLGGEDHIVIVLTGAGHKDLVALDRLAAEPADSADPGLADLLGRLEAPR